MDPEAPKGKSTCGEMKLIRLRLRGLRDPKSAALADEASVRVGPHQAAEVVAGAMNGVPGGMVFVARPAACAPGVVGGGRPSSLLQATMTTSMVRDQRIGNVTGYASCNAPFRMATSSVAMKRMTC